MPKYDYLIVGAGLFGAVFAHEMRAQGKKCLVLERREAAGGNIRCEERDGIICSTGGTGVKPHSGRPFGYV